MRIERLTVHDRALAQASLCGPSEAPDELHVCVQPEAGGTAEQQLHDVLVAYERLLRETGFDGESAAFRRLFVSDYANQQPLIARSRLDEHAATSIIEQPPSGERRFSLWAYHLKGIERCRRSDSGLVVERGRYKHLWSANLVDSGSTDSNEQTRRLLSNYVRQLSSENCSLADHVVRTWLFVRDIDRNYAGMVEARREFFTEHGLTDQTHYIASTGIEGRHRQSNELVTMDAYAVLGLHASQVTYLHAPESLGPTSAYGVTFERGTRISYGDRAHLFISGTASIDPSGATVHIGDIEQQVHRACANFEALLARGEAAASDLVQLILYIRDAADHELVERRIRERWPGVPYVLVRAPVCRPTWLFEVEGIAWTSKPSDSWPSF